MKLALGLIAKVNGGSIMEHPLGFQPLSGIRKKKKQVLLAAVLVWLVISLSYLFQHQVTVLTMDIPGWDSLENHGFQVKQIRLYNVRPNEEAMLSNSPTAMAVILWGEKLPTLEARVGYYKIMTRILAFYRDPYERVENYNWRMEVSGVFLQAPPWGEGDESEPPDLAILADGKGAGCHGFSWQSYAGSDWHYFTARADYVNPGVKEIQVRWVVQPGDEPVCQTFRTSFRTKTYGFFNRIEASREYDNFSPERTVSRLIWGLRNREMGARKLISSRAPDFPWEHMDWTLPQDSLALKGGLPSFLEDYRHIKQVFAVTMSYITQPPGPGWEPEAEAQQTSIWLKRKGN
jgi:hypothetical protein